MNKTITTPIKFQVIIKAEQKTVFDAMTTAKGLDGWFTTGSSVDRRSGGKLIFRWSDWGVEKVTDTVECPIIEVKVPERFTFKWWSDYYTTIEINFKKTSDGTLVSLKEYGYEYSEEGIRRCIECAVGWGEALTLLKFYIEHGLNVK